MFGQCNFHREVDQYPPPPPAPPPTPPCGTVIGFTSLSAHVDNISHKIHTFEPFGALYSFLRKHRHVHPYYSLIRSLRRYSFQGLIGGDRNLSIMEGEGVGTLNPYSGGDRL